MKLERKKNAKKGIVYGVVNKIVTLLFPFVIQTITIKFLGIEYVGIKGLFGSILSILSLAELGVGSAIVYSMYKPIAEDDIETIGALLKLYKDLYHVIGGIILIIGVLLLPFLRFFIHGEYPAEINIHYVFVLYLVNIVISYWMYAYKSSLLSAYQRTDIISNIGTVVQSVMSCIQIIFLITTKNFYVYLWISICFTIINNLITSVCVDHMFPEIRCEGNVSAALKKNIKTNVMGLIVNKICGATRNTFDSIFVSMFLGLAQAAIYSNYFYILSALNGFTGVVLTSLLAGVGNSIALESREYNFRQMMMLNTIYMIIGGWMGTCMLCLYQPFMMLWMGEDLMLPQHIMVLFPIYFYIEKMGDIRGVYADAAGLFWENRYRTVIEAVANIVLNYIFVLKWGIFGIVFATIITLFFIGFMGSTLVIFKYYYKHGMKEYLLSQMFYLVTFVVVGTITYLLCINIQVNNMVICCIVRTVICCILPPVLVWLIVHRRSDYKLAKNWIMDILRNR